MVLPSVDSLANFRWFDQPFCKAPLGNFDSYSTLRSEAEINSFSNELVLEFEQSCGFAVDKNWLNQLGFITQVVVKDAPLTFAHGRVLFSALQKFIKIKGDEVSKFNIVETGTARGFSALCMAKAL